MPLKQNFELSILGTPIKKRYLISSSEEAFKNTIRELMTTEASLSLFAFGTKKFVGEFLDIAGREIAFKPNSSAYRGDSISNSISIHGIISSVENERLIFDVTFYQTNFARFGKWVMTVVLGLTFIFVSYQSLKVGDYKNFLIFGGAILFFFVVAMLITMYQASSQINYFEEHFLRNLEKIDLAEVEHNAENNKIRVK